MWLCVLAGAEFAGLLGLRNSSPYVGEGRGRVHHAEQIVDVEVCLVGCRLHCPSGHLRIDRTCTQQSRLEERQLTCVNDTTGLITCMQPQLWWHMLSGVGPFDLHSS